MINLLNKNQRYGYTIGLFAAVNDLPKIFDSARARFLLLPKNLQQAYQRYADIEITLRDNISTDTRKINFKKYLNEIKYGEMVEL